MGIIIQTKENNVLKPFFEEINVNNNLSNELFNGCFFAVYQIKCTVKNSKFKSEINSAFLTVEKIASFKFYDDAREFVDTLMVNNQIYIIIEVK